MVYFIETLFLSNKNVNWFCLTINNWIRIFVLHALNADHM